MLTHPWKLQLLGKTALYRKGEVIDHFPTDKVRVLLGCLAASPDIPHTREVLADMFWPESAPEAGRSSLRQALASLRRLLEPPEIAAHSVIIAGRNNVQLNADAIHTDLATWDHALNRARLAASLALKRRALEEALEIYCGVFLPGAYNDWVLEERERRQEQYLKALLQLADIRHYERDFDGAVECAQRLLRIDPLHEQAYERLIRMFAEQGHVDLARRQYRQLSRMLHEEYGAEPSPKLQSLYASVSELARNPSNSVCDLTQTGAAPGTVPEIYPSPSPRLPPVLNRFIGRDGELQTLRSWLESPEVRLISVTGMGGIGKTRLAIESVRCTSRFGSAITFIPLADVLDSARFLPALVQALGVSADVHSEYLDSISTALGKEPSLLIMDNFEQISETAATDVMELLLRSPSLTCLITSRLALNVAGEHELALAPLPVPDLDQPLSVLTANPTVQLLVDRMRSRRADFQVTRSNAHSVAALCTRLEGIPLAVELASSWAREMTVSQMLEKLDRRFELLVSRQRGVIARHRTLRAALESSYNMLTPQLQRFFAGLSIFHGGWREEMAGEVCLSEQSSDERSYSNMLRILTDYSLITTTEIGGKMRYSMLESLREFAGEQLTVLERARLAQRHAAQLMSCLRNGGTVHTSGDEIIRNLLRIEEEHENFRAALQWGTNADPDLALDIAGRMWNYWFLRGYAREGLQWLSKALELTSGRTPSRALALNGAGNLAGFLGNYVSCRDYYDECLVIERELGNRRGIAAVLNNLGLLSRLLEDYSASRKLLEESLATWMETGDAWGISGATMNLGVAAWMEGDHAAACELYRDAREKFEIQGNRIGAGMAQFNVASALRSMGDAHSAASHCSDCIGVFRELNDLPHLAEALCLLGNLELDQRRLSEAESAFRESLRCAEETGAKDLIESAVAGLVKLRP